jgi:hypothetical protein
MYCRYNCASRFPNVVFLCFERVSILAIVFFLDCKVRKVFYCLVKITNYKIDLFRYHLYLKTDCKVVNSVH